MFQQVWYSHDYEFFQTCWQQQLETSSANTICWHVNLSADLLQDSCDIIACVILTISFTNRQFVHRAKCHNFSPWFDLKLNYFTGYYPAEDTEITINHQQTGQAQQFVVKGVKFMFQSKLDVVHKILCTESDPLNFLCSSFQIGDLQNVDLILSGNFEKKVPEGVDLLKSSKSVLVHEQGIVFIKL